MNVKFTCFLVGLAMSIAGTANANIYTWTGDDGVLYFSDRPSDPDAKLYIKADPESYRPQIQPEQTQIEPAENDDLATKLDAANSKLNAALDRVETLTEEVEAAESKASAAAAAASLAAQDAADNAARAAESTYDSNRSQRVIYYGTPYYNKNRQKHHISKRHHKGLRHQKKFKNNFRDNRSKRGNHKNEKHHLRGSINKHKSRFDRPRQSVKPRSNHFVDRKFKKFYRRPEPAAPTNRTFRNFGRNSQGSSSSQRRGSIN